jgi:hypothetical protein
MIEDVKEQLKVVTVKECPCIKEIKTGIVNKYKEDSKELIVALDCTAGSSEVNIYDGTNNGTWIDVDDLPKLIKVLHDIENGEYWK